MGTVSKWIDVTFVLIVLFLVLNNAFGFSQIVQSLTAGYTASVKVLQGR